MKPLSNSAKRAASTAAKPRKKARAKAPAPTASPDDGHWNLRLYVAGQTPRSLAAFANLKRLCEVHLPERHKIEVVDLAKQPQLAQSDQIVALPTLVRKLPEPIKRVVGDLSNLEKVLVGLDLQSA